MNTENAKPNLALLIDADNISAKYLPIILNEIPRYGVTTYRRIYGDFTDPQAASWRQKLLDNNITPIQQFSNVKSHKRGEKAGKNATDSTLIIDAMDILYAGKVDGFVIVSSDSDFTRLASRLRESNMLVVGMGRNQTAISFRHACTKFVNIEALYKMEQSKGSGQVQTDTHTDSDDIETTVTLADVENVVAGIIRDDENKGRETTSLAAVGNSLNNKFPDFDVRNFGYSQLFKLIEEMGRFELIKVENGYNVSIKDDTAAYEEIGAFVRAEVAKARGRRLGIGSLATRVYKQFPNFDFKDAGYSQFYKFAASFEGIEVAGQGARKFARLTTAPDEAPAEEAGAMAAPKAETAAKAAPKAEAEAGDKRVRRRRTHKVEQPEAPAPDAAAPADEMHEDGAAQDAQDAQAAPAAEADAAAQPAPGAPTKKEVYAFMEEQVRGAKGKAIGIAPLAAKVRKRFPAFDLHAMGYKQFFELVESSKNMEVVGSGRARKATLVK